MDVDAVKVAELSAGGCRSTSRVWRSCSQSRSTAGRLRFTTSFAEAAAFGDVHFVCVGTPQQPGSSAPPTCATSRRRSTALAEHLDRPCLVVGKSTVPVGTAARLS